ncbi:MAG: hypothetical protein HXM94_01240 [Parvimonas micra]|uniref:Uncharacterized protein n=1 Tax=Parvimonas micra TaxID=33033 RepID=A0A930DYW0_9FIRM|nr:hypothetical protein [Parvimonas micra]MBF1306401.1 hypothetical protein [Parvimonas micra]
MIIKDKREQVNNSEKLIKKLNENLESKLFPKLLDRFQTFSIFISDSGEISVFDGMDFDRSVLEKLTSDKTVLLNNFYFEQFNGYSSQDWLLLKDYIVSDFLSFKLKNNSSEQKGFLKIKEKFDELKKILRRFGFYKSVLVDFEKTQTILLFNYSIWLINLISFQFEIEKESYTKKEKVLNYLKLKFFRSTLKLGFWGGDTFLNLEKNRYFDRFCIILK